MRTFPKYRNQAAIKMKSHVSHETAWVQVASSGISLRQAFIFGSAACDTTSFCLVSHKFKQYRFKARVSRGIFVILTGAGKEAVVTVLAKPNAKLGLIFLDVRRASESIAKMI